MDSTTRAQKDGWWKRAWEYVRKHREMTRIGMIIGCSLAVPFLLASVLAVAGSKSGSGRMVWISAPDGGNHDAAGPMVQQERLADAAREKRVGPKESATNTVTAQVEPDHNQQARR